ncbi:MAG TPA: FAD-linked oxidase C-terminal domain-containing protein [Candidatus Dormibacteraeota bacterium]|jgi:glycolate oxidase subunit GlcD|nr:FAD-linked oxidase C-terminal domain-containing protein [Candidatus Dormibacteraeota bacterium]
MLSRDVLRDLERRVGTSHVYTRPADLAAYAYDAYGASGLRRLAEAVVFPASTDEVAGVVAVCAGHGVAVVPRGAGTGYAGGAAADGGVILNLCRMTRVGALEAEAQRISVEAGVITAEVHARSAAEGLYYPPDPGSSSTSTIGGNVACNAAGPHTLRYGTTTDFVAGLTAVLADGRVLHLGEGADAPQLIPLLCGSEGTLAVITEALLRLIPAPPARATLAGTFDGMEAACAAVAAIADAGIVPAALEFLDRAALDAIAATGAGHVAPGAGALLIVEVEGATAEVNAHGEAVRGALAHSEARTIDHATSAVEAARLWRLRKSVSAAVAKVQVGKVNEDVVVPRDRVAELVSRSRQIGVATELGVVNFGHLGDGNIHTTFLIDPRVAGDRLKAAAAAEQLFETVLSMGGSLSGEHGVGTAKLAFVERQLGREQVALMRRLKRAFDPGEVLNPGKKIPAETTPPDGAGEPVRETATVS